MIGSDAYGYVKVPTPWIHFTEIEGGDDIQYCDGTDINIVTLNTFKPEHLGVSESEYAALVLFKFLLVSIKQNNKGRISLKFGDLSQKLAVMMPML